MELFAMLLSTVALSAGMEVLLSLRVYKDLADRGYRLKHNKLNKHVNNNEPEEVKKNMSIHLIPLYNIYIQLVKAMTYTQNKETIFSYYNSLGALERFTDYEQKAYNQKQTALNALLISAKGSSRDELNECECIIYKVNGLKTIVSYKLDRDQQIEIVDVFGNFNDISQAKRIKIIDELIQKFDEREQMLSVSLVNDEPKIEEFAKNSAEYLTQKQKELAVLNKLKEMYEEKYHQKIRNNKTYIKK